MTREQASCKLWFQQQCGCVTASQLRIVLQTNHSKLSKSLLQSICYPVVPRFYSKACAYGCEHEDTARKTYMEVMGKEHNSFKITKVGLVLVPIILLLELPQMVWLNASVVEKEL